MTPVFVRTEQNTIFVDDLTHPSVVDQVQAALHRCVTLQGYGDIVLDGSGIKAAFPNVVVPIATALGFYRMRHNTDVRVTGLTDYLLHTWFHDPQPIKAVPNPKSVLDRVWFFADFEDVGELVNGIINDLEAKAKFHEGVLTGIEWCLNEVMDNVLQHSRPGSPLAGFVMAQAHSNRVAVCVSDCGQGLLQSLSTFANRPHDDETAIRLAVQESVTRDASIGQGNGLWGLHNIVHNNGGRLAITSGSCSVTWTEENQEAYGNHQYVAKDSKGVTVDFQLNAKRRISLQTALNGHTPLRKNLDSREDEHGCQRFHIKDQPGRTSTRLAGQHLFNRILNTCTDTDQQIVLDFSGVSLVSSSYADETVGKLVVKLGFIDFTQRILLRNMAETVGIIINQAVEKRIAEALRARGRKA